ncbi:MAG: ATP-binding cassette domain-containing protein [bacterium]|nr:ATP-binding cassette domain-containing protein [bacterium]
MTDLRVELRINGLCFGYGDTPILEEISFSCHAGEVHYLLGASGAGKTTLALLIAGVLSPSSGSISFTHDSVPRLVLQFPEQLFLADTIDAEWRLLGGAAAQSIATKTLQHFCLPFDGIRDRSPRSLSFGQRRLLALALQSAHDSPCLLLDEPTLGLDEENMSKVGEWIQQHVDSGGICLVITHDAELLRAFPGTVSILKDRTFHWKGASREFLGSPKLQHAAGFR